MQRQPLVPLGSGSSKSTTLAQFSFLMTLLGSIGCDQDESLEVDELVSAESAAAESTTGGPTDVAPGDGEAVQAEPDLVLPLGGGASLGFILDEDGSIGVLEQVPAGAGVASVLDDPWLKDASPAVIWYALTSEGTEIPEPLRTHHEELAAIGEILPLEQALAGQIRDLAPVPLADEESPCLNATFDANHCDHPDYEDAVCLFNTNGNYNYYVYEADRYKAGFCLQEGESRSWLYYWPGGGELNGECVYYRTNTFIWGADSYNDGDRYAAETYFTYVWWRGVGAAKRAWFTQAIGDPGAVFDWGVRYSNSPC